MNLWPWPAGPGAPPWRPRIAFHVVDATGRALDDERGRPFVFLRREDAAQWLLPGETVRPFRL